MPRKSVCVCMRALTFVLWLYNNSLNLLPSNSFKVQFQLIVRSYVEENIFFAFLFSFVRIQYS